MSLYLKPPRGVINVYKLEECVKQRLICYNNLYNKEVEMSNFDCLVEDSALDRTGHYVFRLMAYSSSTFREIFLENEKRLLLLRLNYYNKNDVTYFLTRLLRHSKDSLESEVHENLNNLYTVLMKLCSQMLRKKYLNHVFDESHLELTHCEKFTLRVPFYICPLLIYKREVQLNNGFVEIPCQRWKRLLLALYDTYLRKVLKEMEYSKNVRMSMNDDRIKEVLKLIRNHWFQGNYNGSVDAKFNIHKIDEESTLFPLCMLNLYKVLQKTNRLSHNERFDFSLYMKGIGVTLSDSLKFWESAYTKEHSTCSKCTHNWQENEKRYIYGIRHLYGLEGSRKNYQVRSCSYLQEKSLCATENGGCPFTHFDDTNLRKVLKKLLPRREDDVEVMIYERKENPSESCKLFYENIFRRIINKNVDNE
ncbi:hypothetical protein NQ314_012952, partial [Rhamnusium bicolor]